MDDTEKALKIRTTNRKEEVDTELQVNEMKEIYKEKQQQLKGDDQQEQIEEKGGKTEVKEVEGAEEIEKTKGSEEDMGKVKLTDKEESEEKNRLEKKKWIKL